MRGWSLTAATAALLAACPPRPAETQAAAPLPAATVDNSTDPLRAPPELRLRRLRQLSYGGRASSPVFSRDGKRLAFLSLPAAGREPDAGLPVAVPHLVDVVSAAELLPANGAPVPPGVLTDLWLTPAGDLCGDVSSTPCGPPLTGCRVDALRELGSGRCAPPQWPLSRTGPCAASGAGDWACLLIAASGTQLWLWPAGAPAPHALGTGTGDDAAPTFAPNGKALAWSSTRGELPGVPGGRVPSGIEVLPAIQFGRQLPPPAVSPPGQANEHPSFFADGSRLVFASNADDAAGRDMDIFRVGADGQGLERITFAPGADIDPAVSPDGRWLAWVSERNAASPGEQDLLIAEWVQ